MKLFPCHGFTKNIEYIFILKHPKRTLEYYFSKGLGILEFNSNSLRKIPNLVEQIFHAEETPDSDYDMTRKTTPLIIGCYSQVYIIIIFKPNIMIKRGA